MSKFNVNDEDEKLSNTNNLKLPDKASFSVIADNTNNNNKSCSSQCESSLTKIKVVRLRRVNGRIVQDCDVYIGRQCNQGGWNLPNSKWHNPVTIKQYGSAAAVVQKYREYILCRPQLLAQISELRGKILGCWCKNKPNDPCHGDVLVELVEATKLAG